MKLVFAGTPEFAAVSLQSLLAAGHEVALVLTQPDRPAGRGLRARASAVKQAAERAGLRIAQPATLKEPNEQSLLRAVEPDAMIVAAFGLLLPPAVLDIPRLGCINVHASLLPRWRGAAPVQRAILAGDAQTGITIMQMDAGLDTGAILLQRTIDISPHDTAGSLHDMLAELGARCVVEALSSPPPPHAQDHAQATYAHKVQKSEAKIEWRNATELILRQIRAFDPTPGAYTELAGHALKIWSAEPYASSGAPGEVLVASAREGFVIATGDGAIAVTELQPAGGRRLPPGAWLTGHPVPAGALLGE